MKKIATLLISLVIILLSCLTVSANTPTAISTEAELRSITSSGNYYLAKDITLTGNFTPLPTFSGTLDGRGKTISGLKISTTAGSAATVYCGLFRKLENGTVVKNLTLKDVDIEISGGLTVYAGAVAGKIDSGSVFNCRVSGKITAHKGNANIHIGGITGVNSVSYAEIYLCENYASISAEGLRVIAGGIAGEHNRPEAEIKQCANYGTISATGTASENYAGGIVGQTAGSVSNCANFGSVSLKAGGNGYVGGITANMTNRDKTISTCFSGGTLECNADTDDYTDPITPLHNNSFSNSYNYYLDNVIKGIIPSEIKTGSALDSKTALSSSAFSGFDFNNSWEMKNSTLKLRGITCPMPISTEQNDDNNTSSSSTTTSSSQTSGNQTSSQPTTSVPSSSEPTSSNVAESSPAESNQTTSTSTSSLPDDKEPQYDFDFIMKHTPPIWVFVMIAVVLLAGVGVFLYFYENRKK